MGIFVWQGGTSVIYIFMVPLAYDNGMVPHYWDWRFRLQGTPLMSVQADINQCGSEGMGISNPRRVACDTRTIGHRAEERKPSFLAQARKNDELRVKSEAICSWWEERMK